MQILNPFLPLLTQVPIEKKGTLVDFLVRLYSVYLDLHFAVSSPDALGSAVLEGESHQSFD